VDLAPNLGGVGEAVVVAPEECARAGGRGRQQPLPRLDPAVGGECGDAARESPAPGHAISPAEIAGREGGRSLEKKSREGGAVVLGFGWMEELEATEEAVGRSGRLLRPFFFLLGGKWARSSARCTCD
jgi:hypothetical protein